MALKTRQKYASNVFTLLKKHYPQAKIVLEYSNPWELLVAVCLSAQCTDAVVNRVTKNLFKKYRTIHAYANANVHELEQDIKPTGFFRNKAKNLKRAAQLVLKAYKGNVPNTMEELLKIPGVARKSANIILGNAYNTYEGIAVDTHVKRLSKRLGLTTNTIPDKIEQDLMQLFDRKDWFQLTYLLIEHGRSVCQAKKPKCDECFLNKICPSAFQFPHFQKHRQD